MDFKLDQADPGNRKLVNIQMSRIHFAAQVHSPLPYLTLSQRDIFR